MRKIFVIILITITFCNLNAQKEKIKGNKIVVTEQISLDAFHTIELHDNFEITLSEDTDNIATIEADSNLQEFITISVRDSILEIASSRKIKRSKALNIKISFAQELKKILMFDKVQVKSLSPLKSKNLRIESNDDIEVFLSVEANKLTSIANEKSHVDIHSTSENVFYQINDNAELNGIIKADTLKIDLYQKASSKLEGIVKNMKLRSDSNTNFYGQKLKTEKATVITEGTSECYILNKEEIIIEAIDKSKIYLLGQEPKIIIHTFANEATLYRKKIDYSPGIF